MHLTRPDGKAGRREAGIRQHRGTLLEGDLVEHNGLLVTSAARAALEYTTLADVEHCLVEFDFLLHHELVTMEGLRERYDSMIRWPHTLITALVLRLADGRSESVGETRIRYLCWAMGLPCARGQLPDSGRERP